MADQGQSPTSSTKSPSTAMTTPQQSPTPIEGEQEQEDDIWASDSDHNTNQIQNPTNTTSNNTQILSDLPTLRRQHMNTGYLEGLTKGKSLVLQKGFDAGYPIGIKLGLRAGIVLGVLEGLLACSSPSVSASSQRRDGSSTSNSGGNGSSSEELRKLYELAKKELACSNLLVGIDDRVVDEATVMNVPVGARGVVEKWEGIVLGGFGGTAVVVVDGDEDGKGGVGG